MSEDLCSVVIPVYNSEPYLAATLASLQAQTHSAWEAFVVIDGKTSDRSEAIAQEFAGRDARIHVLGGPSGGGVSGNRNAGLAAATGRFVAFLDSDDLWKPEKLATQIALMKNEGVAFSFHSSRFISEDGRPGKTVIAPSHVGRRDLLKFNWIGCSTVMLERRAFADIRFPLEHLEDLRLWLKLVGENGVARGLPQALSDYRVRGKQLSGNKLWVASERWRVLCEEEQRLFARVYYFGFYATAGLRKYAGSLR